MNERKGDNSQDSLLDFHRELPVVIEGTEGIIDLVFRQRDRQDRQDRDDIDDLNFIVQSLPCEGRVALQQALWKVVEISARQGVLPRIVEVDRFGNPVERSEN